jgi:hypothetical protein
VRAAFRPASVCKLIVVRHSRHGACYSSPKTTVTPPRPPAAGYPIHVAVTGTTVSASHDVHLAQVHGAYMQCSCIRERSADLDIAQGCSISQLPLPASLKSTIASMYQVPLSPTLNCAIVCICRPSVYKLNWISMASFMSLDNGHTGQCSMTSGARPTQHCKKEDKLQGSCEGMLQGRKPECLIVFVANATVASTRCSPVTDPTVSLDHGTE